MMKQIKRFALVFVFSGLMLAPAWGQAGSEVRDPNSQMTGGPKHSEQSKRPDEGANKQDNKSSGLPAADRKFLTQAAQGGQAEVELGQLAAQRASDEAVKQFGQRMVQDHSKANDELKSLAEDKGVQLPTGLSAKDQALKDKLSKLSGRQFDVQYMQAMVKDHQHDVAEFKKESQSAKDQDVKTFAGKTLPTLEDHLNQAQSDLGKLGGPQKGGTSAQ